MPPSPPQKKGPNVGMIVGIGCLGLTVLGGIITVFVVLGVTWWLLSTRRGLALAAIRDSEVASESLGVRIWWTKLTVYVVAAGATLERSGVMLHVVAGASDILPPTGPTAIAFVPTGSGGDPRKLLARG